MPVEYFERKFDTAFSGCTYIGYFAYDSDNTPAAFCGVLPCYLNINGKKVLSAQIADLITHTNHQRKGLFITLFRHVTELAKKENIKLLFTFPLPASNSYNGFINKLALIKTENFGNYCIPVFCFPIYKVCAKLGLMNFYFLYSKFILLFFKNESELTNSISASGFNYLFRDRAFYQYKKYENNFLINCFGLKVWFKIDDGLFIGDVELNDLNPDNCIKKLKILSFLLGLHCIKFSVSPKLFWAEYLKNMGQYTEGAAICFYSFDSSVNIDSIKFTAGDTDTF